MCQFKRYAVGWGVDQTNDLGEQLWVPLLGTEGPVITAVQAAYAPTMTIGYDDDAHTTD